MRLKITFYNHISKFDIFFIATIGATIFVTIRDIDINSLITCLIGYSIIDLFPALYLHFQYYNKNANTIYDLSNKGIEESKNGKETFYDVQSIEKIKLYIAPNLYERSALRYFSMENYCFAEVFMKDGTKLILTSLLTPKLEEAIKVLEISYERKRRFFCKLN